MFKQYFEYVKIIKMTELIVQSNFDIEIECNYTLTEFVVLYNINGNHFLCTEKLDILDSFEKMMNFDLVSNINITDYLSLHVESLNNILLKILDFVRQDYLRTNFWMDPANNIPINPPNGVYFFEKENIKYDAPQIPHPWKHEAWSACAAFIPSNSRAPPADPSRAATYVK